MTRQGLTSGSFRRMLEEEPFPGVRRRSFSSAEATVAGYEFEPGAAFPIHRHSQEQITLVEEGEIEFMADGVASRMAAGDWAVVAPGVEHGVRAGSAGARILAIVVPRRDAGDAYTVVDPHEGSA